MTPSTLKAVERFFSAYTLRRYRKGQILTLPGEITAAGYFLVEGKVKIYDISYRGDEIIINRVPAPALFPLSIVINHSPTHYTYEADTDIVIRQAPASAIIEFFSANPRVVFDLLSYLYKDFDGIVDRLVVSITGSAKNRLIHALILECRQFGERQTDGSYRIGISEKELAGRAGLSRETVSREVKTLKKESLIEIHRSYVIVPSLARLEEYFAN